MRDRNTANSSSEKPTLLSQYQISVFSDGSIQINPIPLTQTSANESEKSIAASQALPDLGSDTMGFQRRSKSVQQKTASNSLSFLNATIPKDYTNTQSDFGNCSARINQTLMVLQYALQLHQDSDILDAAAILNRSVRICASELNIAVASVNDKLGRQMGKSISDWQNMLFDLFDAIEDNDAAALEEAKNTIRTLLMQHRGKGSEEADSAAINTVLNAINVKEES